MKTKLIITATLFLAVSMFTASCGSKKSETATEQMASAQYQCSMKCEGEKMYDKEGKCPVCNMDLQKTEASQEHNHQHDTTNERH